ncbi:ORC1-type DNA replication protein [Candidatus Bilamarchaeum dharawalense]|uniref:ORC1-type DNA replication protein n=1 Tax=Candidatus Bilamarchaeum dharawalense TaxID=2885759 RepID=A0A5E4LSA3_9ARCH|nr:ORC1-type DNA replication protein [Candidatus Bilamarchaeum dharawalense]
MTSFDKILSEKTIFRDASVLSPHYVPKDLYFREQQLHDIMTILSSALKGQKPRNLIIYGKTGTGKTCTTKKVMDDFIQAKKEIRASIHYINCRIYNSRYRILQRILKDYVPELEKAGFGLPFLYEKLVDVASTGEQLVIILDEIDMIKDLDDLVYTLTRSNDEMKRGGVSIIGISNRLSFKDSLDPRSRSSLYETEMIFQPYTAEQLRKILEQRIHDAFVPGAIDSSAINLAAAITSQENGDARYALKLLNKAAEIVQQEKREKVSDTDVEAARKKVELDITLETINTLPEMHQLVLYAVANLTNSGSKYYRLEGTENTGILLSGEVYEEYERACKLSRKRPRSSRWYKEYLNDLEVLGLITTTPSGKGVRGQTTLIRLGPNPEQVMTILKKNLFGN